MALAASFLITERVDRDGVEEKQTLLQQLRRSSLSLVELQSEQFADHLTRLVEKESTTPGRPKELLQSEFQAVGILGESASPSGWSVEWLESPNLLLNTDWLSGLLSQLPLARVHGEDVAWAKVSTTDRQIYFVLLAPLLVPSGGSRHAKISVGILPTSAFGRLNVVSKGSETSVFVVDGQGVTYSYPEQQYVGTRIDTHPVVARLLQSPANEMSAVFSDKNVNLVGGYEQASKTNLYVVSSAPRAPRGAVIFRYVMQVALVCLGLMLASAGAIYFLSFREAHRIQILEKNLNLFQENKVAEERPIIVRPGGGRELARAVADFLRAPLSYLVGELQIIEQKTSDSKLKGDMNKMNGEVRRLRDFVYGLTKASGARHPADESVDIVAVVGQVLGLFHNEFNKIGVSIEENIAAALSVRGDYEVVKESLKTLLTYSAQKLHSSLSSGKRVILNAEGLGGMAQIKIEVHGVSVNSEERRNFFVPFAVSLPESDLMGLDLALVQSQIQALNGTVEMEGISSTSFAIIIKLPALATVWTSHTPDVTIRSVETSEPEKMKEEESPVSLTPVASDLEAQLPPPPDFSEVTHARIGEVKVRKPKTRSDS